MTVGLDNYMYRDGTELWFRDDKYHRLGGPAYRHPDGTEYWSKDGERHRLDGPAIIHPDGRDVWYKDNWFWPDQSREWWECER